MKTPFSAWYLAASLVLTSLSTPASAQAIRTFTGYDTNTFARNDDDVLSNVDIGFTLNFFGNTYDHLFLSNNGNVQFNFADGTYTPFALTGPTGNPIIAAFFGDVDTRGPGNPVTYGTGLLGGHTTFAANYLNVGVFATQAIFNTFQLLLIDRIDTGLGNFDFEFNYTDINWEAGTASGAPSGGLGGAAARAGFNSGTGTFFEIAGSGVNGAFLDSNLTTGLIHNQLGTPFDNTAMNGRYTFQVRNGQVITPDVVPVPEPSTYGLFAAAALVGVVLVRRNKKK